MLPFPAHSFRLISNTTTTADRDLYRKTETVSVCCCCCGTPNRMPEHTNKHSRSVSVRHRCYFLLVCMSSHFLPFSLSFYLPLRHSSNNVTQQRHSLFLFPRSTLLLCIEFSAHTHTSARYLSMTCWCSSPFLSSFFPIPIPSYLPVRPC